MLCLVHIRCLRSGFYAIFVRHVTVGMFCLSVRPGAAKRMADYRRREMRSKTSQFPSIFSVYEVCRTTSITITITIALKIEVGAAIEKLRKVCVLD